MENNTQSIQKLISLLSNKNTVQKIASELNINLKIDSEWFKRVYSSTLKMFLDHFKEIGEFELEELISDKNEFDKIYETFLNVIKASKKSLEDTKSDSSKKMYALDNNGDTIKLPNFSLNEEDMDSDKKDEFLNNLYSKGIIPRLMIKWSEKNANLHSNDFSSILKMAIDTAIDQIVSKQSGPLMPSDYEEIEDLMSNVIDEMSSLSSLFKSPDKAKTQRRTIPNYVDPNPFETGSYAKVGLNESIDGWSESKLSKFIKKEFDSQIKKGDYMSKKEVKDIIRKTIVKQYKYLWEKSAFFINQI